MATKTITLTGAEVAVTGLDGAHAHIRNDGTEVIYAAKTAGITAGADGVASIPAGQSDTIRGISGAVYLLGTGSVLIQSDDYVASPFKTSAASGGSGADEVARTAINTHAGNDEIHVTAEEKAAWNAVNYSNPNLLDNPDFKINQRGQTEYSGDTNYIYTVDCWRVGFGDGTAKSLKVESDGIVFGSSTDRQYLVQIIENPERLIGDYTLTFCVSEITGSAVIQFVENDNVSSSTVISEPGVYSVTRALSGTGTTGAIRLQLRSEVGATVKVRWAKLEPGSIATPFTPPDPATELAKCQRYYCKYPVVKYGALGIALAQNAAAAKVTLFLPAVMRNLPTISADIGSIELYNGINSHSVTDVSVSLNSGNCEALLLTSSGLEAGKSYFFRAIDDTSLSFSAEL